jgi:transcription elongation factor GreA
VTTPLSVAADGLFVSCILKSTSLDKNVVQAYIENNLRASFYEMRVFHSIDTSMATKLNYLSPEALEKLRQELHELKTVRRRETATKIENAKDLGDLSENAEYHSAKDELAFIEGRVREIEEILKNVEIIQAGPSEIIRVGSTIQVECRGALKTYKIVGSNEADPLQGMISNESPLGNAFLGHEKGDRVEVSTPAGLQIYLIQSIA